ncbi:MAG: hypothetical protein HFE45_10580 [Oscillospiraceae bacterium]|nr:hypothetical protein [Oscillospiraceae bacterium]
MKKTYKAAMNRITVSDALRRRVLAAAKQAPAQQTGSVWLKPALGAAACLVVALAGGTWMGLGNIGSAGTNGAPPLCLTAECTLEDTDGGADAGEDEPGMAGGASAGAAGGLSPQATISAPAAAEDKSKNTDKSGEMSAERTERQLYAGQTVSYETLEEAQAALPFSATAPAFVTEKATNFSVIDGAVLQVDWTEESRSFSFFVAETATETVLELAYPVTETSRLEYENQAVFYGSSEEIYLIVMDNGEQVISLFSNEGMEENEAASMVEACQLIPENPPQETEAAK